jgi:hypothetical protein
MTPEDYSETSVPDKAASHPKTPYSSAYQICPISKSGFPSGTITTSMERRAVVFLEARIHVFLTFGTGVLYLIQINHHPDATVFQAKVRR